MPPPASESNPNPLWTLDRLFLQPRTRVKYYKQLDLRLLKSTKPGQSEHNLLLSATETLDRLYYQVEARLGVSITVPEHGPQPTGNSVKAQLQQPERELSPPPPIASNSERLDSRGSRQWRSSTTLVSSKFEQFMCSDPLPGIRDRQGTQSTRSQSSINDIEDASSRTRTTTINGACFRYSHDATEGRLSSPI